MEEGNASDFAQFSRFDWTVNDIDNAYSIVSTTTFEVVDHHFAPSHARNVSRVTCLHWEVCVFITPELRPFPLLDFLAL